MNTGIGLNRMVKDIFDPLELPTLKAWWAADFGITKDGGNKISQVDDKSGNGRNAIQTVGARKPTLISDGGPNFKNRPIFRLNGSSEFLRVLDFDFGDYTKLNVFAVWSSNGSGGTQHIIGQIEEPASISFDHLLQSFPGSKVRTELSESGAIAQKTYDADTPITIGTTFISSFEYNVNTLNLFNNGKPDPSTKIKDDAMTTLADTNKDILIGSTLSFGVPLFMFNGDIAEILMMGDMTTVQRLEMHDYLLLKYIA